MMLRDVRGRELALAVVGCTVIVDVSVITWMLCGGEMRRTHITALLYYIGTAVFLGDLQARTLGSELWPLLVLVVDVMLTMRLAEKSVMAFVVLGALWLVVMAGESSWRFGLLDLPGLASQEARHRHFKEIVACELAPCRVAVGREFGFLVSRVFIFYMDFVATRGFAREVLTEQAAMERTIATVEGVTRLLAKYDVDAVDRMLTQREADLPALMFETLKQMEENLRQYRPYLPAALFEEVEEDDDEEEKSVGNVLAGSSMEPPGGSGEATIVFTDIRLSTSIWECAPEGMRAGLRIHNAVIRDVMQAFNGYEVKTIGDAFMVAFETTLDGMSFALRVHERLRDAAWPASLLEDAPICAEQGSLWGGLTVRIGVNSGAVSVEQSSVTGRGDYFGRTVNVAARLESTCTPGAVAIPAALCSICSTLDAFVDEPEPLRLKGVSGVTLVCHAWPTSLAGRKHEPFAFCHGSVNRSLSSLPDLQHTQPSSMNTALTEVTATLALVELSTSRGDDNTASFHVMNAALSALTTALDQSGGVLVALLGGCVCVGWNLAKSRPAHMENAIRFVQRLHRTRLLAGAGLVTDDVQYGSVGARNQRFVTVMGPAVRRAWTLCELASAESRLCLYEPPQKKTLPSALDDLLARDQRCPNRYFVCLPAGD